MGKYVILIQTKDERGLVFKVSQILYEAGLNIEKNDEYVAHEDGMFFMRTEVSGDLADSGKEILEKIKSSLDSKASVRIIPQTKKSALIFCTKENHCLGDLLLRIDSKELLVDIKAVISNHPDLGDLVRKFGIEFICISADGISREEYENRLIEACDKYEFDYIFLAKYMRILSPHFVAKYEQRIINIHHSFLPAFIGANPYKQAFMRGVKLIGATAHFVNNELDEGPIITQDVISINHTYSWQDMQKAGRNIEKIVFARAIELVLDDRIFVYGNKTIVF